MPFKPVIISGSLTREEDGDILHTIRLLEENGLLQAFDYSENPVRHTVLENLLEPDSLSVSDLALVFDNVSKKDVVKELETLAKYVSDNREDVLFYLVACKNKRFEVKNRYHLLSKIYKTLSDYQYTV